MLIANDDIDLTPDFTVENHGTIYLLRPLTQAAREWVEANLPDDRQTFGTAVAVEHRYIADIAQGILNDGLTVK
jgi:predicted thioesterase